MYVYYSIPYANTILNMEHIHDPNEHFQFNRLSLTTPAAISGGNYFIKYLIDGEPLYIQPPKCLTKQGIGKAGKRMFCDFIYTNENDTFIRWIEDLQNYSQTYIYDNRTNWFESNLEMHDIENSFTPPLRIYKSGKCYTLRTNIPTQLGVCNLKIFDESNNIIPIDNIIASTSALTILEIQGIRCSARSFQIEIEVKQMLVLSPITLFEKCIINVGIRRPDTLSESNELPITPLKLEDMDIEDTLEKPEICAQSSTPEIEDTISSDIDTIGDIETTIEPKSDNDISKSSDEHVDDIILDSQLDLDLEASMATTEPITIRNRNDVYYDMYRDAIKQATVARKLAISSYMEAKRIKNTYMLDEILEEDNVLEKCDINLEDESST